MADTNELGAVKRRFGDARGNVSMSSTKSAIGHLLGGAGAVETIFCILAIRDQIVPQTLNLDNPDEGTEGADLVPKVAKKRSEEHTSDLQSLMRISYAVFCLKNKTITYINDTLQLIQY